MFDIYRCGPDASGTVWEDRICTPLTLPDNGSSNHLPAMFWKFLPFSKQVHLSMVISVTSAYFNLSCWPNANFHYSANLWRNREALRVFDGRSYHSSCGSKQWNKHQSCLWQKVYFLLFLPPKCLFVEISSYLHIYRQDLFYYILISFRLRSLSTTLGRLIYQLYGLSWKLFDG